MSDFLPVCVAAARAGGQCLVDWQDRFLPREKGPKDLVTEADLAAQEAIRNIILGAFPEHDFLAEEDAAERKSLGQAAIPPRKSAYRWIVDPLDGTANYVHRLQNYAVSIALQHEDDIVCGCVLDPTSGECFTAERGRGTHLDGRPLRVSGCRSLEQAMVAVSFSPNVPRGSIEITRFVEVLHASQAVRRLGSAALNLAYVASGRLDVYWATSVQAWDVAAGVLMVTEAGGTVTGLDGKPIEIERPEMVTSASEPLHAEVMEVLERARRSIAGNRH
ncbi:MAG: inositol monophosphatase [Pirellulaceae bacterium]|jgi:myo-inositol-1(or 4)-monophosphatase|nr:inositol monophosphatase [Pirellulaceae bacterium]